MKKSCLIVTVLIILSMVLAACNPDTEGKTYTIWYDANGATSGYPPTDNTPYKSGDTARVLGKNTLDKTGYAFKNWNTKADGSGDAYKEGDPITVKNTNIRLFAIYIQL